MLEKIYITEKHGEKVVWILSYGKPEFQGGLSMNIDEKTAKEILSCKAGKSNEIIEKIIKDLNKEMEVICTENEKSDIDNCYRSVLKRHLKMIPYKLEDRVKKLKELAEQMEISDKVNIELKK